MAVEEAFASVLAATLAGLILSVAIERLLTPRPPLVRHFAAWALHGGLWLTAHALLTLVLGRPWFAAAAVLAFILMLVLVNNAKVKVLREPFVFQDYDYFTAAITHPRLYIPFLGWGKFLVAATGFVLAVAIGMWWEAAPPHRFAWSGQLGGITLVLLGGLLLLLVGSRYSLQVSFDPDQDVRSLGFLASLWRYGEEGIETLAVASPFDFIVPRTIEGGLPHLVAVQSESFFDPRSLYSGIRPEVLAEFDRLRDESLMHGKLKVPAWGANTIRTEFAFLSGIPEQRLGAHRFNPYRAIARGLEIPSLATFLRDQGYRTVCIHPYPASFYERNKVYPLLGFEDFLDISAFDEAQRFGPYISDSAVAHKVEDLLAKTTKPLFVYVITMENHGPLHLERIAPSDVAAIYTAPPPDGCEDLTIYLRHLRNADCMIAQIRNTLNQSTRPASLCWFGDHVPIMPAVYAALGAPNGDVDYVCWSNGNATPSRNHGLAANHLSISWLREVGLL